MTSLISTKKIKNYKIVLIIGMPLVKFCYGIWFLLAIVEYRNDKMIKKQNLTHSLMNGQAAIYL